MLSDLIFLAFLLVLLISDFNDVLLMTSQAVKKTLFLFSFPSTISHILLEVSMAKFYWHIPHTFLYSH